MDKNVRDWRDVYDTVKGPVAVTVVLAALVLGLLGWRLTNPTLGWDEVAYSTLALFAISFSTWARCTRR